MENTNFNKIRRAGIYVTPLLRKVIKSLSGSHSPMSVAEVLGKFRESKKPPNKATIYRLMTKLAEAGLVQESLFSDEVRRYCLIIDRGPHHHFVCQNCGKATDLPEEICNSFANSVISHLMKMGSEVSVQTIEFEGVCADCSH